VELNTNHHTAQGQTAGSPDVIDTAEGYEACDRELWVLARHWAGVYLQLDVQALLSGELEPDEHVLLHHAAERLEYLAEVAGEDAVILGFAAAEKAVRREVGSRVWRQYLRRAAYERWPLGGVA
jgi:hypothetical protein